MRAKLTAERLFSDPPLTGELPRDVRVAPDGRFATFLKMADDDRERLDLWGADLEAGTLECWLNATELPDATAPSDDERAERERKRLFGHGIGGHAWSDDGERVLIEAGGAGYLLDPRSRAVRRITPAGQGYTDIRLSARGAFVSFVNDGGLSYIHLASGIERAVARSDNTAISYGKADFLAQEEMHRFDGHWWHPDEEAIAFNRVDVSPVAPIHRFDAGELEAVEQRYPFAGADNPVVGLGWYDLSTGATHWLDCLDNADDYLARVEFVNTELAVQIQNRAQSRLRVKLISPAQPEGRPLLEETSETWINLHDNFTPIGDDDYLWTSERDGFSHLFRYRGGVSGQLTQGVGHIDRILHADHERALVSGWFETPTERHLYAVSLDSGELARITSSGWHEIAVSKNGETVVDCYSDLANPGEIRTGPVNARPRLLAKTSIGIGHPYHPYLDQHATPTLGTLTTEDGQTLHYRLTRPTSTEEQSAGPGSPLIVWVYGGPGVQIARNVWPPLVLQIFAQNGFGVLELDNRGSACRGRAFEAPLFRRLGDIEVRDQATGARYAAGLDWVDANRLGVFGHSYGGYMTLMCLSKAPELFQAGVSVAPVTDWRLYDSHYTERYLGHPAANRDGYETSSVEPWLDGLRGKLLVMHGMADDNVLFAHTSKLLRALQQRHIPFELMTYPGAKHSLQEPDVSIHRFNLILDFFKRNL